MRSAIDASGEPPVPQIREWYSQTESEPLSTTDFWNLCRQREQFRAEYKKYWNSMAGVRAVDGVILPVAPSAAAESGAYMYHGKSRPGREEVAQSEQE